MKGEIGAGGNDDVVVYTDVEERGSIANLAGEGFVLGAGASVAGRMVVEEKDGRGEFLQGAFDHEANVDECAGHPTLAYAAL